MGLYHRFSFYTITLKITENFNKNDLKKAIDTYLRLISTDLIKKYTKRKYNVYV